MAVKFGIRNYSRVGDQVTFTLVALNADGTIDTNYTGNFTWGLNGLSDPGLAQFSAADLGQRTYTTTILDNAVRVGLAANFPGGGGANLSISSPNGTAGVGFGNQGDHLFVGGAGNDAISSNSGNDLFLMHLGGDDNLSGSSGNDAFYFGGAYTVSDIVDGGAGNRDQIGLQGNYAGGVTLGSMVDVESVVLLAGNDARFGDSANNSYDYNIVVNASTVVSNNRLTIQANALRVGEDLTYNGSASGIEAMIYAGNGNNNLTGGSGNDGFLYGQGGFGATDVVNGGGGDFDQLGFQGNFTGADAIYFADGQVTNVEFLVLLSASDNRFGAIGGTVSYLLTAHNSMVAAGQNMVIQANSLRAGETLIFNGSPETDGSYLIYSGAGDDFLVGSQNGDGIWGGAGDDVIMGRGGADLLRGGAGSDTFDYALITDSAPGASDQILDFESGDTISLATLAVNTGGGSFIFIGDDAPTGARQVQVVQNGDQAIVNVYLDGDANPDMVIDVTLLGGHTLGLGDFTGVTVVQEVQAPTGPGGKLWNNDASDAFLYQLDGAVMLDSAGDLHALPHSSDLLI